MDHYFQYASARCFYRAEGNGQPIVLIHGFAEDHTVWRHQINYLKPHFTVITPDLPGSGRSEVLASTATFTIEMLAHYIRAVLDNAGIEQCVLLGHSMGGYATLAFAELYANRLLGFGLVHSTAYADSDEKKEVRRRAIGTMEQYGSAAFIRSTTPNTFGQAFKNEHPEAVEELIRQGENFTVLALKQYYTAMMHRPNRAYLLTESQVPVLFIIGMQDAAVPPADALRQSHLPQVAHIHTLPQAGHMGMWEAAAEVNEAILHFANYIFKIN